MASYKLTPDAEQDLRDIARYTLNTWNVATFEKYRDALEETFEAIAAATVQPQIFSKNLPDILVTKYRYHFIFYLTEDVEVPLIIGVIHERRDIVRHLSERLP